MNCLIKPVVGEQCGATDGGNPHYTSWQLSRLTDLMYTANKIGIDPNKIFKLAPDGMKIDWNYSSWKYVAE